jgi:hypothetical protein
LAGAATGKLSDATQNWTDRAHAAADDAITAKRRWVNRASLAIGRDEDHRYVGQTVCALGSMALGAGLWWALDRRLGRSRRAWLRDKSLHWAGEIGEFFRVTGTHLGNRLRGTVAETRGKIEPESWSGPISDEKLCARIRSELGRFVENMRDVQVIASDGRVTLRGAVDGPRINSIGNMVLGIRGVRGLDNRLTARGSTPAAPGQPVPTAM